MSDTGLLKAVAILVAANVVTALVMPTVLAKVEQLKQELSSDG